MFTNGGFFSPSSHNNRETRASKVAKLDSPTKSRSLRQDGLLLLAEMPKIFIADNGQIRNLEDVELAEKIIEKRAKKDPWAVIDELVQIWAKKAPDEVDAIQINVGQYRESLEDKKFGQTKLGKQQERRFKLSFPRTLMLMIRSVYKHNELEMDEKFFNEFAKRYPFFKVAEKS